MRISIRCIRTAGGILAGLLMLQLTGCWSSVELDHRAFARVMLLDRTEEGVELSLGFPLPNQIMAGSSGGGSASGSTHQQDYTYTSKTGPSIGEAFQKIQTDLPRKITFGQLRNIIIGKKYAESREDILALSDFVSRQPLIHINGNLFMTLKQAKHFAQIPAIFERFPSVILADYAKEKNTLIITLKDMLSALYAGGDFLLPELTFKEIAPVDNQSSGQPGPNWLGAGGAGVFTQGRLNGMLSPEQTRAVMWLLQDEGGLNYSAISPKDGKNVSLLLKSGKRRIKPVVKNGEIAFTLGLSIGAGILATDSSIDLTDPVQLRELEQEVGDELSEHIRSAFANFSGLHSDPLQMGSYLRWHHPALWRRIKPDWRDKIAGDVEIRPDIDVTVKWSGSSQKQNWQKYITK
ncbi:Ger(x)C family spore germination protein [Paenibacillus sp. NFR01]|uniref:Ger(x)C family spore germination protein n=1 Tax=Paenibacillus sp. NFR01 TaxID=1566279 RepID=UPI0008B6835B|nr:Ger(x)C family spore germination protein [Paenibacillus sp. NFR01]SET15372.1 spore germination protein KC [Paenibacillus sp. NFR01]